MRVDSLGYQTDLALLQLGGSQIEDRGDYLVIRSPHNADHWWGNFLLLAEIPAPDDSQAWVDRFTATFPDAKHVAIGIDHVDRSAAHPDWFSAHGFDVEVQTIMTAAKVRSPAHPNADAVYRQLRSESDWAQCVELEVRCNERQLDPKSYRSFISAQVETRQRLVKSDSGGWFGAFLEGRLISQMGLISAGSGLARFQSVQTDPDHRRRGLAGSLLCFASEFGFDELAATTLVMVADPDYIAIDLYRAVGFAGTETQLQIARPPAQA